jgi:hypothetical protein
MTDDPATELSVLPFPRDEEEPWRVVDGLADWRAMPPLTPTPPTTAMPFATGADVQRRDTLETPGDAQRHIPTVMQMPAVSLTTEVKRPALTRLVPASVPLDEAHEERLLVRLVVGSVVLALVVFMATLLWPTSAPPSQRMRAPVVVSRPPPPPRPAPPSKEPLLEDLALDPRLHRVDTLAVHVPDLPTQPRHRYLVSVARLPKGATVAARLDDVKEGFGPLFGIVPGRVAAQRAPSGCWARSRPRAWRGRDSRLRWRRCRRSSHRTRRESARGPRSGPRARHRVEARRRRSAGSSILRDCFRHGSPARSPCAWPAHIKALGHNL